MIKEANTGKEEKKYFEKIQPSIEIFFDIER